MWDYIAAPAVMDRDYHRSVSGAFHLCGLLQKPTMALTLTGDELLIGWAIRLAIGYGSGCPNRPAALGIFGFAPKWCLDTPACGSRNMGGGVFHHTTELRVPYRMTTAKLGWEMTRQHLGQ